jgi:hypothetical protein
MKDVDDQILRTRPTLPSTFSSKCPFWDLEYADDTVLISNTFQIIDDILQILEPKANDIGLSLNLDKCEHLRLNSDKDVHFSSGTKVPVKSSVKYLGVVLRPNGSSREDVLRRLTLARTAFKMLLPFFTSSQIKLNWKINVYKQIILAILVYSLESSSLGSFLLTKLDALHFKVMRTITGRKSSFYHKVVAQTGVECTNLSLHRYLSSFELGVLTPSQLVSFRRQQLLGHLIRNPFCIESMITLKQDGSIRRLSSGHRIGAPRLYWAEISLTEASTRIRVSDLNGPPHVKHLGSPFFSPITRKHVDAEL